MVKIQSIFQSTSSKKIIFHTNRDSVSNLFLYKEYGEISYYFTKLFGYDAIIDDYLSPISHGAEVFRTVHLHSYKSKGYLKSIVKILTVYKYAKKIDILFLFQIGIDTALKMFAYRLGGGKGKIYLKLDLSIDGYRDKNDKDLLVWKNMSFYLKIAHRLFKPFIDICSVETSPVYNRISQTYYGDLIQKRKLFLLPNAFDSEILKECGIVKKTVSEKDRIIITVGRIGTYQKNTELLLEILNRVDLKDWKVYIIGPQTDQFNQKIVDFFVQNPTKRTSIYFTGPLSQKELYEYYNRSRVFLLTSREESFAFVLVEAAYMGNYLISTDVGVMSDLLHTVNGYSVDPKDINVCQKMADELQRVINLDETDLNNLSPEKNLDKLTWESVLKDNEGIQYLLH